MHSLGGISAGLNIFIMAILPVITHQLGMKLTKKLENVQCILQRCLLRASNSTPLLAMSWDLGMLPIEEIINKNKFVFLHYIIEQNEAHLSKEIFQIKKSLNLQGFIPEVRKLIHR